MKSSVEIRNIKFETIQDVWRKHLWATRQDPIRAMSSMTLDGLYNMEIYKKYEPYFFGLYVDDKLAGVNSGHQTQSDQMRSRGLFVFSEHRNQGFAQMLLAAVEEQGRKLGCSAMWSFPRLTALPVYSKFGLVICPDITSHSSDHVYAWKKISLDQ